MTLSIIAAIGKNRELGKNNKLLWNIPEDLNHFRKVTAGHAVIMGRKTHESIGIVLPKRINIVITRDTNYRSEGCVACGSINEALETAKKSGEKEVFVIGGGEIYKQAISLADKLYLTLVDGTFDADTFFPDYSEFKKVILKENRKDGNYRYTFLELVRDEDPSEFLIKALKESGEDIKKGRVVSFDNAEDAIKWLENPRRKYVGKMGK